jgi:uncharacterized protein
VYSFAPYYYIAIKINLSNFNNNPEFANWQQKSKEKQKVFDGFLKRANKNEVLKKLPKLHNEAFEKIDCLTCAACCKNYSPRFKGPDIKRAAKALRIKETVFTEQYLRVDEDEDYVTKTNPCPFLGTDNFCSIYADRPTDCRRFPYTDEDVVVKRIKLTLTNSTFCPAVFFVLDKLSAK